MFVTRLISGVILVAVALITIIAGGPVLMVTLAAVSLIGMGELYRAVGVEETGKSACFPWRDTRGRFSLTSCYISSCPHILW